MAQQHRAIAIYLPQFHPIPENDMWWGKGFTEWRNVVQAGPLVKNHYQPHLPADFGFYDLRVPSTREAQAELAREHEIYGFCYYHYWFNGKRLLNLPVDEIVKTGKPDFPFCLAWANENWTRAWDGSTGKILIEQKYNPEDDRNHMRFLCTVFHDKRYIRVDGKPVFIVYNPSHFPEIKNTAEIWREEARKAGFDDLYLCYFENVVQGVDPAFLGFDAAVEFQPNWWKLPQPMKRNKLGSVLKENGIYLSEYYKHMFFDYADYADRMIQENMSFDYKRYRCLMPMWDNSPRRKIEAAIFLDSTPEKYGKWLESIVDAFTPYSREENFIFLNAWNEWAEGNHLEPCLNWGHAYLEKTKQILQKNVTDNRDK
ncbi:MAG: glycoside hydrolase family 99-like domain-containing protein [Bacteroidales bacterium]